MTNKNNQNKPTKVLIPCRISYANLYVPKAIDPKSDPKYSVVCLIDKKDTETVKKVKDAIAFATEQGKERFWSGKLPAKFKTALHDGDIDRPKDEAYVGHYFINANSPDKPQVVDRRKNPIEDPMEVYSGCFCNVAVNFFPYNTVNQGIGAGLGNVQFVRDGERLSGRTTADEDFEVLDDDDDMGVLDEIPDYLK